MQTSFVEIIVASTPGLQSQDAGIQSADEEQIAPPGEGAKRIQPTAISTRATLSGAAAPQHRDVSHGA